jgi:branched-chain amino acid transport system substrate-binding protein
VRHALALLAAGALALLPSCDGAPPEPSGGASPIRVGEFNTMTGSEATFGQSTHTGVMLALAEQNARGGVRGRKIEIVTYDDRGRTQEAGTVVTRLITEDKVVALLGAATSSRSIAAGEVAQQYGIPMITPSSTNVRVTAVGDKIFRVCFVDSFQSAALARFAREHLKARRVAVLFDQSQAYSTGIKDDFVRSFANLGGEVATLQAYGTGDQDFAAQLTTIRETAPDAVLVPGYYTDAANVAIQARRLGITVPLLGGDGWDSAQLAAIGGEAVLHTFFTNHYSPDDPSPEVQGFRRAYAARYGGTVPDSPAALGYDAARLLFDAMARAKSLSGEDLAAALAATRDFPGVTGRISIDAARNPTKPAVVLEMRRDAQGRILPAYVTTIAPR